MFWTINKKIASDFASAYLEVFKTVMGKEELSISGVGLFTSNNVLMRSTKKDFFFRFFL